MSDVTSLLLKFLDNVSKYELNVMLRSFPTSWFSHFIAHGSWQRIAETNPCCTVSTSSFRFSANACLQMILINGPYTHPRFRVPLASFFTSGFLITIYSKNLYAVTRKIYLCWAKPTALRLDGCILFFRNNNVVCLEDGAIEETMFRTLKLIFIIFPD